MRQTGRMVESYFEDQDPRATIPIVSGSNFAQSAIGRPAPQKAATPPAAPVKRRSRRRVFAAAGWVALVLIVAAAAAWISYVLTGSR
jgi:hypothetical protein